MKIVLWIALIAGYGTCFAQNKADKLLAKEHISKQFTLKQAAAGSVFALYNIFGSVKVEGYSGNEVRIEIDQTIEADDAAELARAKQEFKLGFDQTADSVIAYTAAPYDSRPHPWRGSDNSNSRRRYIVKLEYTVRVPNNMSLKVSTVNNGDMNVKDVYGVLNVGNVNGAISIANAKSTTNAHTVNGGITVNYLTNPAEASVYNTINGKIEVTYKSDLAANVQLKSMNGQFYTDFDNTEPLPTEIIKTESRKDNSTTYKLNKNTRIKVGAGGKLFKFETLNGNIYILKKLN